MRKPIAAFTLIELVVVLVLMSLLATLTVMTFGGTMDQYRMSRAVQAIEMFDAHIRREARRTQQTSKASINLKTGKLIFVHRDRLKYRTFRIPSRVEISEIMWLDPSGRRQSGGSVTNFDVASSGRTPSYAMHLTRGKLNRWLVVLGFSGQVVHLDNEGEVNALLSR